MARSYTGARPLPPFSRYRRFLVVGWCFLVVYLRYKRIQRNQQLTPEEKKARYAREHRRNAERIYRTAESLEGLLIKTCQFISSRADVAPPDYVAVLGRLQDRVRPRPFAQVVRAVERELGGHPDVIFA